MYGISKLSIIPVRAEASDKSEMVTQLLFGEYYSVLSVFKNWKRIKLAYDGYEGWIDEKQFSAIPEEDFQNLNQRQSSVSLDLVQVAVHNNNLTALVLGSSLPFYDGKNCRAGQDVFTYEGHQRSFERVAGKNSLLENAYMYLNAPYLWGGRSPFGIDCSGFTQMVYKLSGILLSRDASQQASEGSVINLLEEASPGDLAFFDNEEGHIIHTGLILPDARLIHASGKVRIDKLDHYGIFNPELQKYSHKLRLIKKII